MRAGATGPLSNRLFAAALSTGKRVRSETAIGASRVSVPSVAVELAQGVLGSLAERHVVIIGAGETSELTARALSDQGAGTVFVANRHADRALSLAQRFGGSVVGLERLPEQLVQADIVLASTASPHPIVGREELELVMSERGGRSLLLIDIAVPRDLDPAIHALEDCYLYDIDDLQAVVRESLNGRWREAERAEAIVEREAERFRDWQASLHVVPAIASLRERAESIRSGELAKAESRLEGLSESERRTVESLTTQIVNKLLHVPIVRLKQAAATEGTGYVEVARDLFDLPDDENADSRRKPR
jgi:glutamyl-tRNA reductase